MLSDFVSLSINVNIHNIIRDNDLSLFTVIKYLTLHGINNLFHLRKFNHLIDWKFLIMCVCIQFCDINIKN